MSVETRAADIEVYLDWLDEALADALQRLISQWWERGEFERLKCIELLFVLGWKNKEVAEHLARDTASFSYGGQKYRMQPLAVFVVGGRCRAQPVRRAGPADRRAR